MVKAEGDYSILIAADLQEPPELISQLVRMTGEGVDSVVACKSENKNEARIMWIIRGWYYKLLRNAGIKLIRGRFSGFGIYSKKLIEKMDEEDAREPSLRVLIPKFAKTIKILNYKHHAREAGKSSYSLSNYMDEAINTIFRNNRISVKITTRTGFMLGTLTAILIPIIIAVKIIFPGLVQKGMATILVTQMFSVSATLLILALLLDKIEGIEEKVAGIRKKAINQIEIGGEEE